VADDDFEDRDREIRRLLRAGQRKQANALVVETYGEKLLRYVRGHAPSGADLGDLEDASWEGIFRGLPRFPEDVPIIALVIGVARHRVADAFGASAHDALPSHLSEVRALFPGGRSGPTSPSAAVQREERIEQVRRALAQLREEDRELLDLRWVQDLKPKAIAHVLGGGVRPNAISQRIVAAGKRFTALWDSESVR